MSEIQTHFRFTDEEIEELCKIPPWTDSVLDKQTHRIHDCVPLTRKVIVNQCLFWCDVAMRFKKNLHSRKNDQGEFVVGLIGCGSIGSKFVKRLLKKEMVKPNQIKISSRTPSRTKQRCGLDVIQNNSTIASQCTVLFLFVLPFHFRNFSREIRDAIQTSRPLVISTLAGFTPKYLQRALNTPFLITTGVDMSSIHQAADHLEDEFPLEQFANGEELVHFQESFLEVGFYDFKQTTGIGNLALLNQVQNNGMLAQASNSVSTPNFNITDQPQNLSLQREQSQDLQVESKVNPFQESFEDPNTKRMIHEVSFAAENIINCGMDFFNTTITALKDWISLDPNYNKIQTKPETFNKLWARSFIPLSSLTRVETIASSGTADEQMPVRFMLKRAFIRSLLRKQLQTDVNFPPSERVVSAAPSKAVMETMDEQGGMLA